MGFISDLPTMLVSAFKATLEEVMEADIILHVRDIAHEDSEAQSADVEKFSPNSASILKSRDAFVEVWNKVDSSMPSAPWFCSTRRGGGRPRPGRC